MDVELAMADVPRAQVSLDDARAAADGVNALGLDLLRLLVEGNENVVLSPASIAIALGMARAGARGDTAAEMDAVLRGLAAPENAAGLNGLSQALDSRTGQFPDDEGVARDITLRSTNAPFAQRDMPLDDGYLAALAGTYGAGVRLVDYIAEPEGSRQLVNAWVNAETEGRIPRLLPEDSVDVFTRLILVNAIYLKAPWRIPFHEEATIDGPFVRADGGTVAVPMMTSALHRAYAEGDGWQAVELPYIGGELAMLLVLPEDAATFIGQLDAGMLKDIVSELEVDKVVDLRMPRFGIETQAELAELLTALGMRTAFDPDAADFSGITTAEQLYISAVIHQANIDVDEAGTEAAAATAVIGSTTGGGPPETVEMHLDRPFIFAVRDIETGAVLFLGTVGDPSLP